MNEHLVKSAFRTPIMNVTALMKENPTVEIIDREIQRLFPTSSWGTGAENDVVTECNVNVEHDGRRYDIQWYVDDGVQVRVTDITEMG